MASQTTVRDSILNCPWLQQWCAQRGSDCVPLLRLWRHATCRVPARAQRACMCQPHHYEKGEERASHHPPLFAKFMNHAPPLWRHRHRSCSQHDYGMDVATLKGRNKERLCILLSLPKITTALRKSLCLCAATPSTSCHTACAAPPPPLDAERLK